ncbi:MAG: ribbon-helix-helix domain-containing protein [Bryobacteraceae bacterium]
MSKMQNLQQALRQTAGKSTLTPELLAAPAAATSPANTRRQPSREGQVNISSWLHGDFKSSLRLVQARRGGRATLQDLMAEALNDLFTKYDVPTIQQE